MGNKNEEVLNVLEAIEKYGVRYNGKVNVGEIIDLIKGQQEKIVDLEEENNRLKENEKELLKICDDWKVDCENQKAEIERLTKEKTESAKTAVEILEQNLELQKQVDVLAKENERLSDLEFTQEHCDLYEENKYIKSCLVLAKKQAVKDTTKEIFEKLLNYIGSQQQFCIVNDGHKTLIDCDKLFEFVGKLAQEKGVEVE